TTLTLVTSFAAYSFAERLGFSGVISTVVGGLYYGRRLPAVTSAQTHIDAEASWKTVLFIINGLVFTLIGLQMPAVMKGLDGYSWQQLALYGATIALVVMAVRFLWMFPAAYLPRKLFPSIGRDVQPPPLPLGARPTVIRGLPSCRVCYFCAGHCVPVCGVLGRPLFFCRPSALGWLSATRGVALVPVRIGGCACVLLDNKRSCLLVVHGRATLRIS